MRTTINMLDIASIKANLRKSHPESKPTHRMEAAAIGLGFNTYAGLRTALAKGPLQVEPNDAAYLAALGISDLSGGNRPDRSLSRATARLPLTRVLDAHPLLTQRGFDSVWQGSSEELLLPLAERELLLEGRRRRAYEDDWAVDQFELAVIFLSRQIMINSLNRKISTYGLKHQAESLSRHFGIFSHLGNYVSNGMLIAAACATGFTVRRSGHNSYNGYLNISMQNIRLTSWPEGRTREECVDIVTGLYLDANRQAA